MTVFLCILALIALLAEHEIDAKPWAAVVITALHVLLVLGLTTLAVFTWSQP